jgi:hypothetical protein
MDERAPGPDPAPGRAVVPWTRPEPPVIGFTDLLRRATDLGLGAASIAATAAVDAIERFVPGEPVEPTELPAPGLLRHVPGALVGVGVVAQRRLLDASAQVERGFARIGGAIARTPVVGAPVRATEGYLERWSDVGEAEQARNRALVAEFVRRLAPELATAVVAQLDIDSLVSELPIDSIVSSVDIDALLERVDVERIIERVDVGQVVARVDVNAIVDRVDVQAIMGKVDIAPMAEEIIGEVDIGAIVRQSTGSITGDVVDGGRLTAMRVDGFIDRVVDHILFRRRPRDLSVPGFEPVLEEEEFEFEPAPEPATDEAAT